MNETQGLIESICSEDFAPIVTDLGLTLSGLELDFELSEWAQLNTLQVKLYESEETASFVRELECGVDFTYVPEGNYLHFDEAQVPPSEYWIVAEYEEQENPNTSAEGCGEAFGED